MCLVATTLRPTLYSRTYKKQMYVCYALLCKRLFHVAIFLFSDLVRPVTTLACKQQGKQADTVSRAATRPSNQATHFLFFLLSIVSCFGLLLILLPSHAFNMWHATATCTIFHFAACFFFFVVFDITCCCSQPPAMVSL